MQIPPPFLHTPYRLAIAASIFTCLAGCSNATYDRINLGQSPDSYERAFPADKTRRSPAGLCYLDRNILGRTEAVVLILTVDQRVAAKLRATQSERDYGFRLETDYVLEGTIDPDLIELRGTGPIDTLRAVTDRITSPESDQLTRTAHGWVAAGLLRLVEHWPHAAAGLQTFPRLSERLSDVPGGGTATITVNPRGRYELRYTQTAVR